MSLKLLLLFIFVSHAYATCWGSCATGSCSGLGTCNSPYGFANSIGFAMKVKNEYIPIPPITNLFVTHNNLHKIEVDARIWKSDFDKRYSL